MRNPTSEHHFKAKIMCFIVDTLLCFGVIHPLGKLAI